jgi:hypothetical protein
MREGARNRVVSRGLWIGAAIAVTVGALILVWETPKDDVAWLVYLGEQVLHGERLYVDLVDVNPPLIVLLSALPAWLAEWLGLPSLLAFYVASTVILALCAWIGASLLRCYSALFADRFRTTAFVVVVLVLAAGAEFGQREHLFAALVLPYLALFALQLRGGSVGPVQATLAGLLGGIGFALKPHFLLALALLELGAAHRGLRIVRRETVAVALVLCVYALTIAVFFPTYLTDILPLAVLYYRAWSGPWQRVLLGARYVLALAAFNGVLRMRSRQPAGSDPLPFVLSVVGFAAAIVYVLQWKGWMYHTLPCSVALALRAAYVLTTPTPGPRRFWRWPRLPVGMLLLVAGLGAVACESFVLASEKDAAVQQLATLVRRDHVRSLLVLSPSVSPAFPVVNETSVAWTSHYDTVWALVSECSLAKQGDLRARRLLILRQVVRDFVTRKPDLVAINAPHAVEYLGILSAQPAFAAAWHEYQKSAEIVGFEVFTRRRLR